LTFPYLKKNHFFIIYGRDGSSHRPKDLGVVSTSFILVPVRSSREKKGIYRTFERFSCIFIHIHNAPKTDVAGLEEKKLISIIYAIDFL